MRAGERYWGWFEELGDQPRARAARAVVHARRASIATGATTRPITRSIMKTLYGLSWRAFHRCTCTGPTRGLHPIPVRGSPPDAAAVRARVDRLSLPGDPVRGAAGRDGLPIRARVRGAAAPPPRRRVLTLAQPHYFFHAQIACFDAPITTMAFAVGFAYWKSLREPALGDRGRRAVRHRARRQAQRLADAVLPRRALPVDAARRSARLAAAAGRGAVRAGCPPPLAFVSMLVLGPDHLLRCTGPGCGTRPSRARAPTSTATSSTSTTTSSTSAGTGTTRPRPPRASSCARPPRSSRPASPCRSRRSSSRPSARGAARAAPARRRRCRRRPSPKAPIADAHAELAAPGRRRRSRAGRVPAGPDARPAGRARGAVDADLRRREALHDRDAVPRGARRASASPSLAPALVAARAARRAPRLAASRRRRRWRRSSACRRSSRRGARTPTACRTTTCSRAASRAARRWG